MKRLYNLSAIKPFEDTLQIYTMYHLELLLSVHVTRHDFSILVLKVDQVLRKYVDLQIQAGLTANDYFA